MRHDEYCRLHAACLAMANQATEPKMRDRWSAMADAWLRRATEPSSDGVGGQANLGAQGHRAQVSGPVPN
jgi:hypothetical protein